MVTYTILPGDTLASIANRYGVGVETIMQVNNLTSGIIYPGQTIRIPISGPAMPGIPGAPGGLPFPPGNRQLEQRVNRLEREVDRLQNQYNRLDREVNQLNRRVRRLEQGV